MPYAEWNQRAEARSLSARHTFCRFSDFVKFIETYEFYHMLPSYRPRSLQSNDQRAGRVALVCAQSQPIEQLYEQMRIATPFSRTERFPEGEYLDLDNEEVRTFFSRLFAAVYIHRTDKHNKTGTDMFELNFASLRNIAKEIRPDNLLKYGVYDRMSFEAHFELTWTGK